MQARAIFEAACDVTGEGIDGASPEIMIPLVGTVKELDAAGRRSSATRPREVFAEKGVKVEYLVGTMIELPRGALAADQIAEDGRVLLASAPTT